MTTTPTPTHAVSDRRHEAGVALLVSMMVLIALSLLVMGSLESVMRDQQIAGFQSRKRVALHAADAGSSAARASVFGASTPALPTTDLGDSTLYPRGMPSFGPDPNVSTPIEDLGAVAAPGFNLGQSAGSPKYQIQYWRFHIEGDEPNGATARVELATGVLKGN